MKRTFLVLSLVVCGILSTGYLMATGPTCNASLPCGAYCAIAAPTGGTVLCYATGNDVYCFAYNSSGYLVSTAHAECPEPPPCGPCAPMYKCNSIPGLCPECCFLGEY